MNSVSTFQRYIPEINDREIYDTNGKEIFQKTMAQMLATMHKLIAAQEDNSGVDTKK